MAKRFSAKKTIGVSGYPKQRNGLGRDGLAPAQDYHAEHGQKTARKDRKLGIDEHGLKSGGRKHHQYE